MVQEHVAHHDACVILCLNGLMNAEDCQKALVTNPEVNTNSFITHFFKIAKESSGLLMAAAMQMLEIISLAKSNNSLNKFKIVMESECDVATKLQEIMKNLLVAVKTWDDDSRTAVKR